MKVGELFAELRLDDSEYNKGVDNAGNKMGALKKTVLGAVAGITAGFVGVGGAGLKMASDLEESTDRMQAQLGATGEEAKNLSDIAQEVWEGAFGESVQGVQENIATLRQSLGDMSDETTKEVTEAAMTVEDLFGASIEETTNVVKNLRDNFDDLSETDAMDLITTGFQEGGDYANDLMDTLREYAPQFADIGFTADQFLSTLIAGADEGAWNMDKVGDSVKELNNTIMNGEANEALEDLGLNAEELTEKFMEGGEAGEGAFQAILAAISSIEDPVERNRVGVELFKTQWEDLGSGVVTAMAEGAEGVEDFQGRTKEAADNAYNNLATSFTEIKRSVQGFLTDAMQPAVAKVSNFADDFNGLLEDIRGGFETDGIRGAFEEMIPDSVRDDLAEISGFFTELQEAMTEGDFEGVATMIEEVINSAFESIADLSGQVKELIVNQLSKIDWAEVGKAGFVGAAGLALGFAEAALDPMQWLKVITENWQEIALIIVGIIAAPAKIIKPIATALGKIPLVGTFAEWVVNSLSNLGGKILKPIGKYLGNVGKLIYEALKEAIQNRMSGLATPIRDGIRVAIQAIRGFFGNAAKAGEDLGIKIGEGIGNAIGSILAVMGRISNAIVNFMRQFFGSAIDLGVDLVGAIANGIRSAIKTITARMALVTSAIIDAAESVVGKMASIGRNIIEGIGSGITAARKWLKKKVEAVAGWIPDWIKKRLGIKSPARETIPIGTEVIRGIIKGMEDEENNMRQSATRLMNSLQDELQAGTDIQRRRDTRSSEMDLLEDEIEYLQRENATREELAEAKRKEIELDELRADKLQEYNNKMRDQRSIMDAIEKARQNGEITQKTYNELIAEATTQLNDLKSAEIDLQSTISDERQEEMEATREMYEERAELAKEAQEEAKKAAEEAAKAASDAFSDMAESQTDAFETALNNQLEALREKNAASVESFKDETSAFLEELEKQKEARLDAFDEETAAREKATDEQIASIEKRKNAELSAIDEQLNAMDQEKQANERDDQRAEWDTERGNLNRRMEVAQFMGDDATVEEVKQEIADFEQEIANQRREWQREDKRESLKNEKDRIEDEAGERVNEIEQELEDYQQRRENQREHLEMKYEQRAESYEQERQQRLEAMEQEHADEEESFQLEYERQQERFTALSEQLSQHVADGKMTQQEANAAWMEAVEDLGNEEVTQQIENQERTKAELNKYVEDYVDIGESYGDGMIDGLVSTLEDRLSEVKSVASNLVSSSRSSNSSNSGSGGSSGSSDVYDPLDPVRDAHPENYESDDDPIMAYDKFHDGGWVGKALQGLKGNEIPAILEKGEFVLSKKMLSTLNDKIAQPNFDLGKLGDAIASRMPQQEPQPVYVYIGNEQVTDFVMTDTAGQMRQTSRQRGGN